MSGEIELSGGPLPPAFRQGEYGIEPIRESFRREPPRAHSPSGLPRPDWLMFGVPRPGGGFRLYACKDVEQADVTVELRKIYDSASICVDAQLGQTLIIDGASYGECLARMAEIWRNWDADGREMPPAGSVQP